MKIKFMIWFTFLIASFLLFASRPISAQSDPCALPTLLASFEAAALSDNVATWSTRYDDSDCPDTIKLSAQTFAEGYYIATADFVFQVPSTIQWNETGVQLQAGQQFVIIASGGVEPCTQGGCDFQYPLPPDNTETIVCNESSCAMRGARFIVLVGRIGDGEPFYVGKGGTFTADASGDLYLGVNDTRLDDNVGSFIAAISVFD